MVNVLIIVLFTIFTLFILLFTNKNGILKLVKMYKNSKSSVSVLVRGGLGNRLMSFAGIIVMSIYFKSKPFCIFCNFNI